MSAIPIGDCRMFLIYSGDTLIGTSMLEHGDPPMSVAFGRCTPTEAFQSTRALVKHARGETGVEQYGIRHLAGLRARTEDGTELVCMDISIAYSADANPAEWEVNCLGIEPSLYAKLFSHHEKAYRDRSKG
jgi:hypothetical protein